MQLQHFMDEATNRLHNAGIETARLDVLVLLEDVLRTSRANLLAHPELTISPPQLTRLNTFIVRRCTHLPLAYIRGRTSFYGRDFALNTHVLVPRPETETMIELLRRLTLPARPRIADVGTGSGCIGITAALELPDAQVTLIDIDAAALRVAQQNADSLAANVTILKQDLLANTPNNSYDVVLANLPYVPDTYTINRAAAHEPHIALFGGKDGLDLYRTFWQQIHTIKPRHALTESLMEQHEEVTGLAREAGYEAAETEGLVQVFTLRGQPQA